MVARDKRYVPKGGYLVDFETRVTPKLKRIMAKETGSGHDVAQKESAVTTKSSDCMAMVVWDGNVSNSSDHPAVDIVGRGTADAMVKATQHWKPPGCLKRHLWNRPARWPIGKKKTNQRREKREDMGIKMCVDDDREQKLEEERCALEREKKKLAEQQDVAQRRIIQAESLMSKCSREVKAFQTYKEEEMERIRQMKVSLKQKRIRDKLAGASEARGSVNHAEIAKLRVQIEEYETALKDAKAKAKTEAQKHHVEISTFREREKKMEQDIMDLQETLTKYRLGAPDEAPDGHEGRTTCLRLPSTPDEQPRSHTNHVIEEIHHPNNTLERRWGNGSKQFVYQNGDVRQTFDSQVVQYYYSSIDCWNTSYPNGDHVYYFKDGRRECHCADGTIQILLQNHQVAYSTQGPSHALQSIAIHAINTNMLEPCPTRIH